MYHVFSIRFHCLTLGRWTNMNRWDNFLVLFFLECICTYLTTWIEPNMLSWWWVTWWNLNTNRPVTCLSPPLPFCWRSPCSESFTSRWFICAIIGFTAVPFLSEIWKCRPVPNQTDVCAKDAGVCSLSQAYWSLPRVMSSFYECFLTFQTLPKYVWRPLTLTSSVVLLFLSPLLCLIKMHLTVFIRRQEIAIITWRFWCLILAVMLCENVLWFPNTCVCVCV